MNIGNLCLLYKISDFFLIKKPAKSGVFKLQKWHAPKNNSLLTFGRKGLVASPPLDDRLCSPLYIMVYAHSTTTK